jgi:rod shape-determining protein MreB and related proteins
MFGFRTKEFAVDLGSSNIRIAVSDQGVLAIEATRAIVYVQENGEQVVLAVGNAAADMHGKMPSSLKEVSPIRDGMVQDFYSMREILKLMIIQVNDRLLWANQHIRICIPFVANLTEQKSLKKLLKEAGASKVSFVNRSVAAATSIDLPFHEAHGHMIVDIGSHTTEISVLSCGDVVESKFIKIGGENLNQGIVRHIRKVAGIEISLCQANDLKKKYGSAMQNRAIEGKIEIKGLSVQSNFPKSTVINTSEITVGLGGGLQLLIEAIQSFLDDTPLELASDIAQIGVVLIGGGALLRDIDEAISEKTNLPVVIPDSPELASVLGALDM